MYFRNINKTENFPRPVKSFLKLEDLEVLLRDGGGVEAGGALQGAGQRAGAHAGYRHPARQLRGLLPHYLVAHLH